MKFTTKRGLQLDANERRTLEKARGILEGIAIHGNDDEEDAATAALEGIGNLGHLLDEHVSVAESPPYIERDESGTEYIQPGRTDRT